MNGGLPSTRGRRGIRKHVGSCDKKFDLELVSALQTVCQMDDTFESEYMYWQIT